MHYCRHQGLLQPRPCPGADPAPAVGGAAHDDNAAPQEHAAAGDEEEGTTQKRNEQDEQAKEQKVKEGVTEEQQEAEEEEQEEEEVEEEDEEDYLGLMLAWVETQQLREPCGISRDERGVTWSFEERDETPGSSEQEKKNTKATVSFMLAGVPHHFCGAWCTSKDGAQSDVAERVLWYFDVDPDDRDKFELPINNSTCDSLQEKEKQGERGEEKARPSLVPPFPASQVCSLAAKKQFGGVGSAAGGGRGGDHSSGGAGNGGASELDDKTVLMQVQNLLQKVFAKEAVAGEKVWIWSYEMSETDKQTFKAKVDVPLLQKSFEGTWCRGKKAAQRNACLEVKSFLDQSDLAGSDDASSCPSS